MSRQVPPESEFPHGRPLFEYPLADLYGVSLASSRFWHRSWPRPRPGPTASASLPHQAGPNPQVRQPNAAAALTNLDAKIHIVSEQ